MPAPPPRRRPRPAPPPAPAPAAGGVRDPLDAELLDRVARAGGRASLRRMFGRHDPSWTLAAPLWALAAAHRLHRAALVELVEHGPDGPADVTLTLTPAGLALAEEATR